MEVPVSSRVATLDAELTLLLLPHAVPMTHTHTHTHTHPPCKLQQIHTVVSDREGGMPVHRAWETLTHLLLLLLLLLGSLDIPPADTPPGAPKE